MESYAEAWGDSHVSDLGHYLICAIIMMLVAGILGGGVNCLQARKADEPLPKSKGYYFLLSIAASFSVPLFLSLTKSELLGSVLSTDLKAEDWFILFAVCLVAAIYAQTFLESISKNLLERVQGAEDSSRKALHIAEAAGEQSLNAGEDKEAKERITRARAMTASLSAAVDPEKQKVLNALKNPKYQLGRRTLAGIISETKLSRQTVSAILNSLIAEGAAKKETGEITDLDYYVLSAPAE